LQAQHKNLKDQTQDILRLYHEGIQNLKVTPLHPKLSTDGKKHLIDIYYKEEQMNSFRDSLVRQLDKLNLKIAQHLTKSGLDGEQSNSG
jgi:hypothetical protein